VPNMAAPMAGDTIYASLRSCRTLHETNQFYITLLHQIKIANL